MEVKDYSKLTRDIYHKQHTAIANDEKAMNRFINMFSTEYFGVDKDFFVGKKILDAGCGDTAKIIIALSRMGASEIDGFDLGQEFITVAKESLKRYGVPLDNITLKSANLLSIPYSNDVFDFVVCHGVLLHLNNMDEVKQAFSELARVTKKGGYLYTVYGLTGGLLEDAVIPAIRNYYRENKEFKDFIDNETPSDFHHIIYFIETGILEHENKKIDLNWLKPLFDIDFSVFVQNMIQAPVRLRINEDFIREMYVKNNFSEVKRLHRYVKRENLRKFFSPLHYHYNNKISKLIYGSGNLEFIARKN